MKLLAALVLLPLALVAGAPTKPAALYTVAQSTQPSQIMPPIARSARAKFPGEQAEVVDGLALINLLVNHAITGMSDQEHYGVSDKAVSWPDDLKGDCEDYALSKQASLGRAGFPIVGYTRIRNVIVARPGGGEGHAILEVRLPHGSIAFLDNLHDELMTRAELTARGYTFFDW